MRLVFTGKSGMLLPVPKSAENKTEAKLVRMGWVFFVVRFKISVQEGVN